MWLPLGADWRANPWDYQPKMAFGLSPFGCCAFSHVTLKILMCFLRADLSNVHLRCTSEIIRNNIRSFVTNEILAGSIFRLTAGPSVGSSSSTAPLVVPSRRKRLPSVSSRRCRCSSRPRPPSQRQPRHRWSQLRLLPESEEGAANWFQPLGDFTGSFKIDSHAGKHQTVSELRSHASTTFRRRLKIIKHPRVTL